MMKDVELPSIHPRTIDKYYKNKDGDILRFNISYKPVTEGAQTYGDEIDGYGTWYEVFLKAQDELNFLTYHIVLEKGKTVSFGSNYIKSLSGTVNGETVLKVNNSIEIDFYGNDDPLDTSHVPLYDNSNLGFLIDDDDIATFKSYLQQSPRKYPRYNIKTYGSDRIEMADYGSVLTGIFYSDSVRFSYF
jgi:hypothetical protein